MNCSSLTAFFVIQELQPVQENQTLWIICHNSHELVELKNDLKQMISILIHSDFLGKKNIKLPINTLFFDNENEFNLGLAYTLLNKQRLDIILTTLENLETIKIPHLSYLNPGIQIKENTLINQLTELINQIKEYGYYPVQYVDQPGEFSLRGSILDIFSVNYGKPIRIEFDSNKIERINFFDVRNQTSIKTDTQEEYTIVSKKETNSTLNSSDLIPDPLEFIKNNKNIKFIWNNKKKLEKNKFLIKKIDSYFKSINFIFENPENNFIKKLGFLSEDDFLKNLEELTIKKIKIVIFYEEDLTSQNIRKNKDIVDRIKNKKNILLTRGKISSSFFLEKEKLLIANLSEIIKSRDDKKNKEINIKFNKKNNDFLINDLIIHKIHGIGKYLGLKLIKTENYISEFLSIQYAENTKLYLPIDKSHLVYKYKSEDNDFELDSLSKNNFQKRKLKIKESIEKLALNLIETAAKRKANPGLVLPERDSELSNFENEFAFQPTEDQFNAIEQVLADLSSGNIMDRIICGDVGFGKTEIAMRAAFQVVYGGKQVVVLVPTTLLARQHYRTFKDRFKNFPIAIECLSRLTPLGDQKKIIHEVGAGKVDILIGTHRVLSKDIQFSNLGLAIVDEEHRFGVQQKELLKNMRINTHFLALSATPIPRTLSMGLSGLREISLIQTPPKNRLPIKTQIIKWDDKKLLEIIHFEIKRKGQVFFIHNEIKTIQTIKSKISKWFPEIVTEVIHAKMEKNDIEKILIGFQEKKIEILISTTIMESGIDFPNANTMIINEADYFGLSQLYQLRGRIGRGYNQAFAYLIVEKEAIEENKKNKKRIKRLQTIENLVELGNSFQIACADLEIRGGGNLLGSEQSGEIRTIGFEMYTDLLEETIFRLKSGVDKNEEPIDPEIHTHFSSYISEEFIPHVQTRLSFYRQLSQCKLESEVKKLKDEIQDRFGKLPLEALNLIWLIEIKIQMKKMNIQNLVRNGNRLSLTFSETQSSSNVQKKISFDQSFKNNQDIYLFLKTVAQP